jgi:beta-N-acetylhexosaminidase
MKHAFLFLLFITSFFPKIKAQSLEDNWVNTTYDALNDTQRIGQLIMIRAHSNLGSDHVWEVEDLIKRYHIGSLCFFQGTPEKQAQLTNRYQALSGE